MLVAGGCLERGARQALVSKRACAKRLDPGHTSQDVLVLEYALLTTHHSIWETLSTHAKILNGLRSALAFKGRRSRAARHYTAQSR